MNANSSELLSWPQLSLIQYGMSVGVSVYKRTVCEKCKNFILILSYSKVDFTDTMQSFTVTIAVL